MAAPRFFITHSWKDLDFAKRLADDLRARGLEGFFDFYSIKPGENISERIGKGLEECDIYVPILSFVALESRWCQEEINAAITISNEVGRNRRPIILPVLIENCQSKLPVFLRSRLYINFTGRYDEALRELLEKGFGVVFEDAVHPVPEKAKVESVAPRQVQAQTRVPKPLERTKPRPTIAVWSLIFVGLLLAVGICVIGGSTIYSVLRPPPSVDGVTLTTAVDSGFKATSPTTTFKPTDKFFASVQVSNIVVGTKVDSRWYFGADEVTGGRTSITSDKTGSGYYSFSLSSASGFPVGDWKVEIYLDGKLVNTTTFKVAS